jgi:hypothetical protein
MKEEAVTFSINNELTPWSRVLLEMPIVAKLVKNFPAFTEPVSLRPIFYYLCLSLPNSLFAFQIFVMLAAYPNHLFLTYLITVIISGKEFKLWSSSLSSFLHPPVTSSLSDPNIL